ncbi:hypothetical protein BLA18112_03361 [Burkholderia lata]|uniref:Uncharacterized protein n=1 Tax=Burkholderia lata (strain ATCC 17760 / DSM 23089 / LMG 22485 / NCIMB 9086 / R18194 / 383) TaxID=482957 RepID=A0A6P2WCP4_BURL3|nr:hypothetical protein [Burkholderia lata]VWC91608.1 hypothetical protein BLA18112_03361 [Burkholderia lata]
MAELQKASLGAVPDGSGGDNQRVANIKFNSNVDVLKSQATLASAATGVTSPRTLTVDEHVGRRVGISLAKAGVVKLPSAKKCAADQVIHLRNVGTTMVTLAVEDGSGDYIGLDRLQPFESVLMDTNGSTGWWVLFRGRASSGDERVSGSLTVDYLLKAGGDTTVGGGLAVNGGFSAGGDSWLGGRVCLKNGLQTGQVAIYNDPGKYNAVIQVGALGKETWFVMGADGSMSIPARPTWLNGVAPWDTANLSDPLRASAVQAISATGGDEGDLSNVFQVRLAASFTAGAKSVSASASLFIRIAAGAASANDFLCYLDVVDVAASTVVASGPGNMLSVPNGQQYAGLASTGSLSCNVATNNLTVGKQYQVRLFVRKNVLYGPIYPMGMSITGMVA